MLKNMRWYTALSSRVFSAEYSCLAGKGKGTIQSASTRQVVCFLNQSVFNILKHNRNTFHSPVKIRYPHPFNVKDCPFLHVIFSPVRVLR